MVYIGRQEKNATFLPQIKIPKNRRILGERNRPGGGERDFSHCIVLCFSRQTETHGAACRMFWCDQPHSTEMAIQCIPVNREIDKPG